MYRPKESVPKMLLVFPESPFRTGIIFFQTGEQGMLHYFTNYYFGDLDI